MRRSWIMSIAVAGLAGLLLFSPVGCQPERTDPVVPTDDTTDDTIQDDHTGEQI